MQRKGPILQKRKICLCCWKRCFLIWEKKMQLKRLVDLVKWILRLQLVFQQKNPLLL